MLCVVGIMLTKDCNGPNAYYVNGRFLNVFQKQLKIEPTKKFNYVQNPC